MIREVAQPIIEHEEKQKIRQKKKEQKKFDLSNEVKPEEIFDLEGGEGGGGG